MAVGGIGGTKIPNALYHVLSHYAGRGEDMETAVAAPRLHCIGNRVVMVEKHWDPALVSHFKALGFKTWEGTSAFVSAVSFDPRTGAAAAER